jgi:hypothetical protein
MTRHDKMEALFRAEKDIGSTSRAEAETARVRTHLELAAFPREHGRLALGKKVIPSIRSKLGTIHLGQTAGELQDAQEWMREKQSDRDMAGRWTSLGRDGP